MDQEQQHQSVEWWTTRCSDMERWIKGQQERIEYLEQEVHRYQCLLRGEDTFMNSFKTREPDRHAD